MPYFADSSEVDHFLGGIFEACFNDSELMPKFEETGVKTLFHFTDPDSKLFVDWTVGKVYRNQELDGAPEPNMEMYMTADISHEYWLGKRNVAVELAKGGMRVKGPIPKVLKIVPLTKYVFPLYQEMIAASGRTDLNPA